MKLDLLTLKSVLADEKASAQSAFQDATLARERADAMDYYYGRMDRDMPAAVGRSKAVSTDVADTVEGIMPSIMDILVGGDEVVKFQPVGQEDEKGAQQESDYTNHVFMQQNSGFMVTYTFVKDCLLQKVGIVKVGWEDGKEDTRETYLDQPEAAFVMLTQAALQPDSGLKIIAHTANKDGTHDLTILKTKTKKRARVYNIPPEEFGIERAARYIRGANYCFHEIVTKTEADLISEGYDEGQVRALQTYGLPTSTEQTARDSVAETSGASAESNPATRLVRYTEHYIRADLDGHGPCLYQVITGGEQGEILRKGGKDCIEPFDVMPFAVVTPIPVPHRFWGRSLADLVMDIQRIKTALVRGKLDNLYLHNNPRVEVAESFAGPNTLDDLLVSRPGGIVRTKQPGGVTWQVVPDITGSVYPGLEYWDAVRETRTGVTRVGQGLDANALQNETATKANQVFTMAQARIKLIAKIIAETGFKDLFWLLHGTIRRHGQQAQTVRLRNEWVEVDPRNWKTRDDMTIEVGLGNGGRAEQFAQSMAMLNIQKELLLGGKTNLVDDAKLFNSVSDVAKIMGKKNPDNYINDPNATVQGPDGQPVPKYPPPQPQPPEAVQVAQIKAQTDQQKMGVQAQLDAQADQRKAQIEATQAQADIATQDRKTQAEMIQTEREFQLKKELAIMEFELQRQIETEKMQMQREMHQQTLAQNAEQHRQQMESGVFKVAQGQEQHSQKMELAEQAAKKPKGEK